MSGKIGSIYGPIPTRDQTSKGAVRPIGIGRGGEGDEEYLPIEPASIMIGQQLKAIEVPRCLSLRQFLEIQTSGSD